MTNTKSGHFVAGLAAIASAACCPCYSGYAQSASAIQALSQKTDATPADECELKLYIEHTNGDGVLGMSAIEMSSAKPQTKADTKGQKQVRDGVCVKHVGQELALPSRILIAAKNIEDFWPICDGEPISLPGDPRNACVWNHTFRNRYPFSFTFVASEGKVSDYVSLARVYRNGSLIARYNSASKLENEQVLALRACSARSSPTTASAPSNAVVRCSTLPCRR